MNVKDLIKELSNYDPEAEVILQKDPEGNGYSNLNGADPNCIYVEREGNVYSTNFTAAEVGMEEDKWKELCKKPKCVVLYPLD